MTEEEHEHHYNSQWCYCKFLSQVTDLEATLNLERVKLHFKLLILGFCTNFILEFLFMLTSIKYICIFIF